MALRNKPDLAISLILNSSVQIAIALTPALVLISLVVGGGLTLVLSPLLLAALTLAALLTAFIVFDGETNWLEGLALIGLYLIIAASVWYGQPIQRLRGDRPEGLRRRTWCSGARPCRPRR